VGAVRSVLPTIFGTTQSARIACASLVWIAVPAAFSAVTEQL